MKFGRTTESTLLRRGVAMTGGLALGVAAALVSGGAFAQDTSPKPPSEPLVTIFVQSSPEKMIDLEPGKPIEGSNGRIAHGHKGRADKGRGVLLYKARAGDAWQRHGFTFSVKKGGPVHVSLRGALWRKDANAKWVPLFAYVDDLEIEVDGEPLDVNGGMEEGTTKRPVHWKGQGKEAKFVAGKDEAHQGERCAYVSGYSGVAVDLNLEEGKTYKVSAWFRYPGDRENAPDERGNFRTK